MAMTNTERAALHSRLTDVMGQEQAETLMEQLPPSGWDNVATKDDLKILGAAFTAALAETNAALKSGLAETNAALKSGLAETNAAIVEAKADAREGFARMERRLAYYLVAVAALIVGFGLAVWIPLMAALHEYTTSGPPPAAPPAVSAPRGDAAGSAT